MSSKRTTTGDTATKAAAPPPSDRELVISRIIDESLDRLVALVTRA